jgi:hypothetical protein
VEFVFVTAHIHVDNVPILQWPASYSVSVSHSDSDGDGDDD